MTVPTKIKDQRLLINPGVAGVVYNQAGASIGGGERLPVDELDDVGQRAVDTGQLLLVSRETLGEQ